MTRIVSLVFLALLANPSPAVAQSCSIQSYGSSFSGSCRDGGTRYNINGDAYGPARINGYTPGGTRFHGTINDYGRFRGYIDGRYTTCTRYGCN